MILEPECGGASRDHRAAESLGARPAVAQTNENEGTSEGRKGRIIPRAVCTVVVPRCK